MSVAAPVTLLPLAPQSAPSQQVILLPHVLRAPRVISACVDIFRNGDGLAVMHEKFASEDGI